MGSPRQLGRALIAAILVIAFYVLAFGVAGFFAWACYSSWRSTSNPRSFLMLAFTFVVIKALFPPAATSRISGVRLLAARQPRLFALIREVAEATGQRMPAEVYLIGDVNAGVMRRGGVVGVGGRETLAIGLPLLEALSVAQLRSVLAHEFGHYHGGDTALGPWIYGTREAIQRVFHVLSGGIFAIPFVLYWRAFMRVTQAISRGQERAADRLAAQVAGPRVSAEGLRRTHGAGLAYEAYWSNELGPILEAGFLPPVAEGFALFMTNGSVAETVTNTVAAEMTAAASPYDSHPPLRERIAEFKRLPPRAVPADDPRAIGLLDAVPDLERRLLGALWDPAFVRALRPIAWADVARAVHVPRWRAQVAVKARALAGVTVSSLPTVIADLGAASGIVQGIDPETPEADRRAAVEWLLGAALAATLDAEGWTTHATPGAPVWNEKEGERIEPFLVVEELGNGRRTAEDWARWCSRWGLHGVELAPASRVTEWSRKRETSSRPTVASRVDPAPTFLEANAVPASITMAAGLAIWLSGNPMMPQAERELRQLRAACDKGEGDACFHLAYHHLGPPDAIRDLQLELELYRKACSAGVPEGCYNVANSYHACRDRPRDRFLALRYFEIGCSMGLQDSCAEASNVRADPVPRPVEYYRDACAAGEPGRCTDMGTLYQCGAGDVTRDTVQAAEFYRKGCSSGDSVGCEFVRSYGYELKP